MKQHFFMNPILASNPRKLRFAEMQEAQYSAITYIDTNALFLFNSRIKAKDESENLKASSRFYFINKIAEHLTDNSFLAILYIAEIQKIGIVGEYCITLMYLDNHFQDQKFGVNDELSRLLNRQEREDTWNSMSRYIETEFNAQQQTEIWKTVEKLFALYSQGMTLDNTALSYENFASDNKDNLHLIEGVSDVVDVDFFINILSAYKPHKYDNDLPTNYLRLLFTRAYLINTVFFQVFTELLIRLYGDSDIDYNYLISFARIYGMGQQLVNDNCDYLPISYGFTTVCKFEEDTFSDFRRGLVTLPIATYLARKGSGNDNIFEHYANKAVGLAGAEDKEQKEILLKLKSTRALTDSIGWICGLARAGEAYTNDPILRDMLSFVLGNRFYKEYHEFNG
ncbi:MAG: hypothetical protein AB8H47_27875 [Bacteroidia bacterium]